VTFQRHSQAGVIAAESRLTGSAAGDIDCRSSCCDQIRSSGCRRRCRQRAGETSYSRHRPLRQPASRRHAAHHQTRPQPFNLCSAVRSRSDLPGAYPSSLPPRHLPRSQRMPQLDSWRSRRAPNRHQVAAVVHSGRSGAALPEHVLSFTFAVTASCDEQPEVKLIEFEVVGYQVDPGKVGIGVFQVISDSGGVAS
jgi:hypothetical protein